MRIFRNVLFTVYNLLGSRDIAAGTAAGYGLNGRRVGVRVSVGPRFSPSRSHPIDTDSSFPGGKTAGA
jgi:hypothetical protein